MIKKIIMILSLLALSIAAQSKDLHDHSHGTHDHSKKQKEKITKTKKTTNKEKAEEKHEHGEKENENDHDHEESHADHDDHKEDARGHGKDKDDKHGKDEHTKGHEDEHEEGEHGHDDEHGEENAQIGVEKGILEADKEKGFKLSSEAEANFIVEKVKVQSSDGVELPKKALVTSTIEVNVYRYRDGYYKRIDFNTITKSATSIKIKSKDLKQGDEIATTGLSFLRVTEIAAFDGAPEGHSH